MKVLLLAAGAGSRMKEFHSSPKPLIDVRDKPLLWWAIKGFHELTTSGRISNDDIFIVILKKNYNDFSRNKSIMEFFGERNPFIVLDEPTTGPVESALQALIQMRNTNLLSDNESIVLSDSDHFVQSIDIYRNLNKHADVYLWEAKKDQSLEWSFLSTTGKKIIEKPRTTIDIDVNRGLIGVYGFDNNQIFIEKSQFALSRSTKEVFISDIVNSYLQDEKRVTIGYVEEFYPMGTPGQLEKLKNLPDPTFAIFDSPTYFVDIDGVLVHHNTSVHGEYPWDEDKPLSSNIDQINDLFNHARIVLVSARPKKYETEVKERLEKLGICFDEIILGCTGGRRYLVNDLKPKAPFIPTANAINIIRNSESKSFAQRSLYKNISGGSGAVSVVIQNENSGPYVIKYSIESQKAETLSYQANWYDFMSRYPEIRTLKVIERYDGSEGFYGFATSHLKNIQNFYEYTRHESKEEWIGTLKNGLTSLYNACEFAENTDYNLLGEIITKKVFPSLQQTSLQFADYPEISDVLQQLFNAFDRLNTLAIREKFPFTGRKALIHGDATFENLQIDLTTKELVLIDPVGRLIEPEYEPSTFSAESYPIFDLARLELSFKYNYENHIYMSQKEELSWDDCRILADSAFQRPSICSTAILDAFSTFDTTNLKPVLATTIGRILKYKENPKEAFILANQCLTIVESC